MSRTNSASTLIQQQMLIEAGKFVDAEQIKGVYYGVVVQTDKSLALGSSSPIPTGMMTVNIPQLGVNYMTDPVPYPDRIAPPLGTRVAVGFDSNNKAVAISLYDAVGVTVVVPLRRLNDTYGTQGSLTITNGLITDYVLPT